LTYYGIFVVVLKTASPGIVVNEVDLTRGTSDAITTNIGAFVGPFEKGPVGEAVLIETETQFQTVFGNPTNENYEYWWTVSNFLEYGGVCYVVRCDDAIGDTSGKYIQTMKNATDEVAVTPGQEIPKEGGHVITLDLIGGPTNTGGVTQSVLALNVPATGKDVKSIQSFQPTTTAGGVGGVDASQLITDSQATAFDFANVPAVVGTHTVGVSGGDGTNATFDVVVDGQGEITSVTVNFPGTQYNVGNTLTLELVGSPLENAAGPATLDIDVTGVNSGIYPQNATEIANATGGSGSGLSVEFQTNGEGDIASISIVDGGSRYADGDTVTFTNVHGVNGTITYGLIASDINPGGFTVDDGNGNIVSDGTAIIPTVPSASTNGTGLVLSVPIVDGDIDEVNITIDQAGSGYLKDDTVEILTDLINAGGNQSIPASILVAITDSTIGEYNNPADGDAGDVAPVTFTVTPTNDTTTSEGTGLGVDVTIENGNITSVVPNTNTLGELYLVGEALVIHAFDLGVAGAVDGVGNPLDVVIRVADATAITGGGFADVEVPIYVKNETDFYEKWLEQAAAPGRFIARNPGTWGNGIGVAVIDAGADYRVVLDTTEVTNASTGVVSPYVPFNTTIGSGYGVGKYIKVRAVVPAVAGVDAPAVGDVVTQQDFNGNHLGGVGHIVSIKNDVYKLLVVTGEFNVGDTFATTAYDAAGERSNEISAVYNVSELFTYSFDEENEELINVIVAPVTYTAEEGADFGWPLNAVGSTKVRSGGPADLGDVYFWNPVTNLWTLQFELDADDVVTDGTNVYRVYAAEDWYTSQEAFSGIPWYRFASRPGTTQAAFDRGCTNDEMNIIIYDADGNLTGTKGNTLEQYFGVSKLANATSPEGEKNYYVDVINNSSAYLFANKPVDGHDDKLNELRSGVGTPIASDIHCEYISVGSLILKYGVDNLVSSLGELQDAYNIFVTEDIPNLDYILQGPAMSNLDDSVAKANFIISILEERKDCMGFLSPPRYATVGQPDAPSVTQEILKWANELTSTSYAVFDSGYKYTYDRFNDRYRYVPLNGDIAGLVVNAALTSEPWYSPAGLSRGQIRNVVRLPYNPSKKQRDQLYTARVNPVVTFPGEGTILFGDKTALGYSSAFDRINVRRLFLVIEREIAKISRTVLFEFNDEVTRSLFKNNVNPFLRDVQAKRGMYDFLVVCDTTNNVPEIIDRNEFIADIYIKPSKSINFITLNFIATKTGVTFDESVGLFRGANSN